MSCQEASANRRTSIGEVQVWQDNEKGRMSTKQQLKQLRKLQRECFSTERQNEISRLSALLMSQQQRTGYKRPKARIFYGMNTGCR